MLKRKFLTSLRRFLPLALVFALISSLFSAPFIIQVEKAEAATFVKSATGTAQTATSVSATLSPAATAGNLIIAVVGARESTTITGPDGFSTAINETGTPSQGIFYKTAAGGETTITGTTSTSQGSLGIQIFEYSGAGIYQASSSASGSGTTPLAGTITTTLSNELILAAYTDDINTNHQDTSWYDVEGFTELNDFKTTGSGTNATYASGHNLTNSPSTITVSTNIGSSANWRGQLVRFFGSPTAPTVTNVTSSTANGSYKAGQIIAVQVVFSEAVNVTGTPQIILTTGSPATTNVNYSTGTGTNTLVFNYTVSAGNTSADLDYSATTSLILNSGTIKNAGGIDATLTLASPGAAGSLGFNKNIIIDTSAPNVTNVSSTTANGSYGTGETIAVTVTFNENVNVTGPPRLLLETGTTDRYATYASGTGTSTLTFNYAVFGGDTTLDLDYFATNSLELNGGTIKDAATNNAALTLPNPGEAGSLGFNKNIVIDTTAPAVTNVTSSTSNGSYKAGQIIPIQITFNEIVNITGTPQLILSTGNPATTNINYASGSGTNTITFNYTVAGGNFSSNLSYSSTNSLILSGGTIQDAATNNAVLTLPSPGAAGSLSFNKNIVIDTTAPVLTEVTPIPTPANDTTPSYTFNSTENGTISYGGDCSSITTSATVGNNTVTFNTLSQGLHNNCTITVTDAAGNASVPLNVSPFTVDTTPPTLAEVTPVTTPTSDSTPDYTFNSTEAGGITYGGDCSSPTTSASAGNNTITFNTLADGTHNNCTIRVTDAAGNLSSILNVSSFRIDTTAPILAEVTPVPVLTNDNTPSYTFSSTETGSIIYSGDCSSIANTATVGNNTITFNTLADGLHNNCSIQVTDSIGNARVLNITAFTVDTLKPVVTEVTPVLTPTNDNTPSYTFNTTEAGNITYGGNCSSPTTSASTGNNTITFNTLADGTHNNCTIRVTDAAGNLSLALNVSSFRIDTTPPTLAEVTPVVTPANDTTPSYTFSSTEAGTITYGGDCSSATTSTTVGDNTITFNALAAGTHNNCTILVTDSLGNPSPTLNVFPFTIDIAAPIVTEVTPVVTPTRDTTPNYTFNTTEGGTITYGGDCSSSTTLAITGDNTITFNALSQGTHDNCTITVTDSAGNPSITLNVPSFTIDTIPSTLAEVTPVPTPANNTTPDYTFSSTEAGTITYGGDCSSAVALATAGNNTITFNALANGTHNNCTILVTDSAGNPSATLNVSTFTIDTVSSAITNVTSPTADGTYTTNHAIHILITFNEPVSVTGTPQLTLETEATDAVIDYEEGSGSDTLVFHYLVSLGEMSSDLDYKDTSSLSLNGGTIKDLAGNDADLTLPTPGTAGSLGFNKDIVIDTTIADVTPPAVTEITSLVPNGSYGVGQLIPIRVHFSESVDVTGTPQLTLETGTFNAIVNYDSNAETHILTFNYTVSDGESSLDLDYTNTAALSLNGGTIKDLAGNDADLTLPAPGTLGSLGFSKDIVIDTASPTVSEITPVVTPANDTTPNYTFNTTEAGTITYGGDCSSSTTLASAGNNTITFNPLTAGTHNNCTITVTDSAGNTSTALNVSPFTIDTSAPTLAEIIPVPDPTNNVTPSYTFNSTEDGTITYGGDCSSVTAAAAPGDNIITFNALSAGNHNNCTIIVTDSSGNPSATLDVSPFTIDLILPTVTEVTPISSPTIDRTPDYTFNTTEDGVVTYSGDCSSSTTLASAGNNTITFNSLPDGLHNNCSVTVTDAADNPSAPLGVSSFVVDTGPPVLTEITPVSTPINDTTPSYTFNSSEPGTITYGGDCVGTDTTANSGDNTITFSVLPAGLHDNCTITVKDEANNLATLDVSPFTIDITRPVIAEVTPVPTPIRDTTPDYTFSSTEISTILYTGDCSSSTVSAAIGNNTITFNTLAEGLHDNCTIIVTDAAGNASLTLDITPFLIDISGPTIAEVTPVSTPTRDSTPSYTFSTTEPGVINYGGDCSSTDTTATTGNNTITFSALPEGLHNNCTITVTDGAGNPSLVLDISPFTIDTAPPTLAIVTPVATPTNDSTPSLTFSTTEPGAINYGGDCSSADTVAAAGNNTITFNALSAGTHLNCTITVTDTAGNPSLALLVPPFTIDTTPPLLSGGTVTTPTNDPTPSYTFSTNEAGTITYGGDCASATLTATTGDNTVTFNALLEGTYTNCTITVTDAAGNPSAVLNVPSFTINLTAPAATLIALSDATTLSIKLTWTAPGDNGNIGTAASYNIRYSTSQITDANFSGATLASNIPAPEAAGTVQTLVVSSLSASTRYYFAMKTLDHVGNVSTLSNVPNLSTSGQQQPQSGGGGGGGLPPDHSYKKEQPSPKPAAKKTPEKIFCGRSASTKIPFIDIKNHWGKFFIENLYRRCIVDGKTQKLFVPETQTTRAELVKAVINTFNLGTSSYEPLFSDVSENDWFAKYVIRAAKLGILNGYVGKTPTPLFQPNQSITRAEALKIILKAKGVDLGSYEATFPDVGKNDWFYPFIAYAYQNHLISGSLYIFDKDGLVKDNYSFPRLLEFNNTGPDVFSLKEILANLSYYTGNIDDSYDSTLVSAVKKYQLSKKLFPSGKFWPLTRDSLLLETVTPKKVYYFKPHNNITRAEMAKIIYQASPLELTFSASPTTSQAEPGILSVRPPTTNPGYLFQSLTSSRLSAIADYIAVNEQY